MYRTHKLNELGLGQIDEKVVLSGWVNRRRDHGGLIFIDLRDRYGITQVVFDPSEFPDSHSLAESLRSEFVIKVEGKVRPRPEGMVNPNMETGTIEVLGETLEILNKAKTPPFEIDNNDNVNEELRLKYRYLDLRKERMQRNIILRHDIIKYMRDFMDKRDFLEIETPILVKGTPEGSREYMVPSRLYPGSFYVLPQSPQQLKQLLMLAGFDKYFQIARCFRDEDQRGDRQPEFSQLDIEMSFVEEDEIMELNETLLFELIKKFKPEANLLWDKAKVLTYHEAMNLYGSDKPDLRFEMGFKDCAGVFKDSGFKVFKGALENGGVVKALKVPSAEKFTRKVIDELTEVARTYKAKGLAYIIKENGELRSPVLKFLGEGEIKALTELINFQDNEIVFFAADEFDTACNALGNVRLAVADMLEMRDNNDFAVCWVTDFPMFEWSEDFNCMQACHHPFTSPKLDEIEMLKSNPEKMLSRAYDIVLNGNEIGGGSIRIHDQKLQSEVFTALGISEEDAQRKFGHMLEAFEYGAPPHGGLAWGIERLIMIFAGEPNIREVMAFPKDQKAKDVMLGSPAPMPQANLDELSIKIVE